MRVAGYKDIGFALCERGPRTRTNIEGIADSRRVYLNLFINNVFKNHPPPKCSSHSAVLWAIWTVPRI